MTADTRRPIYTPHPWTEFEQPTAEQVAVWLESMTHEERVEIARRTLQNIESADRCFIENHDGLIADLQRRLGATGDRDGLA